MAIVSGAGDMFSSTASVGGSGARDVHADAAQLASGPAGVYVVSWLRQDNSGGVWQDLEGGHWVAKN